MEIFKLSKSLGFTEKLTGIKICDLSLLAKWLREKHNIIVLVDYEGIDGYYYKYYYYINEVKKYNASDKNYITFEEAYEIGLQEALKLIK